MDAKKKILKKKKSEKKSKNSLTWDRVEAYLNEQTKGGAAMSLVETEKILREVLLKLDFPGKTLDKQLLPAKDLINNYDELEAAREVTRKIKENVNVEIDPSDAKETLNAYWDAIRFLTKNQSEKVTILNKIGRFIARTIPDGKKLLRNLFFFFFLFFLSIYLLDKTSLGQAIAKGLVGISHFLFSWILFTFLLLAGVLIIIISTIFYFEKRREKKSRITISENVRPK